MVEDVDGQEGVKALDFGFAKLREFLAKTHSKEGEMKPTSASRLQRAG
jgi:hypothetical protein